LGKTSRVFLIFSMCVVTSQGFEFAAGGHGSPASTPVKAPLAAEAGAAAGAPSTPVAVVATPCKSASERTSPYVPAGTILVNIEGNIGIGKSTLLGKLRETYAAAGADVCFVDEPVAQWEEAGLLAAMYDGSLNAAVFQVMALTTRYAALVRALKSGAKLVISERSLYSDRAVFAGTHLTGADKDAYELSWASMLESLPDVPNCTVLLDAPVPTLMARVSKRAREGEGAADDDEGGAGGGGVSADYLTTLEAAHEAFFSDCDHAKARVDATAPPDDVAARVLAAIDAAVLAASVADAGPAPTPAPHKPALPRAVSPSSVSDIGAAL